MKSHHEALAEERRFLTASREDAVRRAPAKRTCLRCRGAFKPQHRYNFLCTNSAKFANRGEAS